MVSQMWLDMASGMASQWGLFPEQMLLLIGVFFAIAIAVFVSIELKRNHVNIESKNSGVFAFFLILVIEVFIGMIEWIYFVLPLLLMGTYYFYIGRKEEID